MRGPGPGRWAAVAGALPAGVDPGHVRAELDRIGGETRRIAPAGRLSRVKWVLRFRVFHLWQRIAEREPGCTSHRAGNPRRAGLWAAPSR